jgi:hypothetical protein
MAKGKDGSALIETRRGEVAQRLVVRVKNVGGRGIQVPDPDRPQQWQVVGMGRTVRMFAEDYFRVPSELEPASDDVQELVDAAQSAEDFARTQKGDSESYVAARFYAWACRQRSRMIRNGGLERMVHYAPALPDGDEEDN